MSKYRRVKVLKLRDQSFITFGTHFVKSIMRLVKRGADSKCVIKQMRDYLDAGGANSKVRQELLDIIARERPSLLRFNARSLSFSILLDESTTHFCSDLYWDTSCTDIWQTMAQNCTHLKRVVIQFTNMKSDDLTYFEKILQNNKNMEHLALPICGDSERMLRIIDENCKQLKYLGLQNRDRIAQDAEFLRSSNIANTLTTFSFYDNLVKADELYDNSIATILKCCPNLESLHHYRFVGAALKICLAENPEFKCKLKMMHDSDTTRENLAIIVKTCPKLKLLFFFGPNDDCFWELENAALEELAVHNCVSCASLISTFEKVGRHLLSLSLHGIGGSLDICGIKKNCPNLAKLEFQYVSNMQLDVLNEMFPNLQELRIFQSNLADDSFGKLLLSAQHLRFLQIDHAYFDDDFVTRIFGGGHFKNLEHLNIDYAPQLTIYSLQLLLDCCPNLQTFGSFTGWSIRDRELKSLKCLQAYSGRDIELKLNYSSDNFILSFLR